MTERLNLSNLDQSVTSQLFDLDRPSKIPKHEKNHVKIRCPLHAVEPNQILFKSSRRSTNLAAGNGYSAHEILPRLSRVAVFDNSTAGNSQVRKETEDAARALGLKLQYLDIRSPTDIETAFREARKARADAVLMLPNPIHFSQRKRIVALAIQNRLPAIYGRPEYVEAGGLMNYGVSFTDLDRRAAIYVDKILKGAKPAELPVEQPTKFEMVINLKTAKQIGLTIPPNVLARADKSDQVTEESEAATLGLN